jgi:hypothetical protein
MSDTPETDDIARGNHVVPTEWAQQLERERDEAFELLASEKITRNHIIKRSVEVEKERDEAREKLSAAWQSLRDSQDEVLRLTFENRELRNLSNE